MAILKSEGYDYAFDSLACEKCGGKCCTGESGYIWVNDKEIGDIADFLGLDRDELIREYILRVNFRYTLKEKKTQNGFECVFFDSQIKGCKIYGARPNQCRSFPFWEHFKNNKKELENECIGILPL